MVVTAMVVSWMGAKHRKPGCLEGGQVEGDRRRASGLFNPGQVLSDHLLQAAPGTPGQGRAKRGPQAFTLAAAAARAASVLLPTFSRASRARVEPTLWSIPNADVLDEVPS